MRLILAAVMFCIFATGVRAAVNEFAPPDIARATLENGLEVVVIPDRRAPVVTHMVWYKAGAADDPPGKSGIAHFLEHLMFKGTKNTPAGEFSRKVAEIGGQENAFTSFDYTAYFQKVSPEALEMVMGYEADRMENLVLTDEVIQPEKNVVLQERRSRVDANPDAILSETVDATLFYHHPYGIPVIGWPQELQGLTREDAVAFYKRFYSPNNAVLVVAGDVDPEATIKMARDIYGKVEKRVETIERSRTVEPEPVAARMVEYLDERVRLPNWQRLYMTPSYMTADGLQAESLDVLSGILGGASTSRLYRELVLEKKLATSASAYYRGTALDQGQFGFHINPRPGVKLPEIESAIDEIIADILENGVTQEELERAKNNLLKSIIFERDSQTTMARLYGSVLSLGGDLSDIHEWPSRIDQVTVDGVNAVARAYLKKRRSVTAYLRPQS
jgi:zinc protease